MCFLRILIDIRLASLVTNKASQRKLTTSRVREAARSSHPAFSVEKKMLHSLGRGHTIMLNTFENLDFSL
jgi:hypothetical protein